MNRGRYFPLQTSFHSTYLLLGSILILDLSREFQEQGIFQFNDYLIAIFVTPKMINQDSSEDLKSQVKVTEIKANILKIFHIIIVIWMVSFALIVNFRF